MNIERINHALVKAIANITANELAENRQIKKLTMSAAKKQLSKKTMDRSYRNPSWLSRNVEISPGITITQFKSNGPDRSKDHFEASAYQGKEAQIRWKSKKGTLKEVIAWANTQAQQAADFMSDEIGEENNSWN